MFYALQKFIVYAYFRLYSWLRYTREKGFGGPSSPGSLTARSGTLTTALLAAAIAAIFK